MYETPGLIRVVRGTSCTSAANALQGGALGFRVQQSERVPASTADSGTVFMNGWQVGYQNQDHHVQGFGAAIINVTEARDTDNGEFVLNWEAGGVLSDENGDDPYDFCYSYSVVFWSRRGTAFDAVALARSVPYRQSGGSDPGNDTALREAHGSASNAYGPGVVLPQGFALMWTGNSDRHLLQAGFDFGVPAKTVDSRLSWTSRTLLKDNDQRNDYMGAELVTVLSYASPQMLHPQSAAIWKRSRPFALPGGDSAHTFAQDEATCVVYGMPREAMRLGAAEQVLPLQMLSDAALAASRPAASR